uniref:GOLD domain-containing protein n=1 Tax=Zea mays TaxID=4577 RepID=A0A804QRS3_MAIZE
MTYKGPLMVTDDLLLQGLRNASSLVPLVWFMQRMVMLLPRDNNREADMRTVSERTNSTVAWFSILSLGVCVAVSVLQLWHLQGFFRKKKLI